MSSSRSQGPGLSILRLRGAEPTRRWMLVLHGILGSKSNWRAIVRRVLAERPEWGAVLVDLRMHGASMGFAAPHTLSACSADLIALSGNLGTDFDLVLGHSFGGKVALQHTRDTLGSARAVITVDSVPGARPSGPGSDFVLRVLDALDSLGSVFASREGFIASLQSFGIPRETGGWLAMNLTPDPRGSFSLRLEVSSLREMLGDYFAQDLWTVIEEPPGRSKVHLVIAGLSGLYTPEDRARAEAMARARPEALEVHFMPDATHWVHVDAPEAMASVMLGAMD